MEPSLSFVNVSYKVGPKMIVISGVINIITPINGLKMGNWGYNPTYKSYNSMSTS